MRDHRRPESYHVFVATLFQSYLTQLDNHTPNRPWSTNTVAQIAANSISALIGTYRVRTQEDVSLGQTIDTRDSEWHFANLWLLEYGNCRHKLRSIFIPGI